MTVPSDTTPGHEFSIQGLPHIDRGIESNRNDSVGTQDLVLRDLPLAQRRTPRLINKPICFMCEK